ncbi:hypothetical protein LTS18_003035, partial [Coniosporium uncinatum]
MLWWRRIEPAIVQAVSTELDTEDYVVMEDDEDDSAGFDNDGGGRGKWSKSKVSEEVLVVVLLCSDEIEMKVLKVGQAEHSVCFQRTLVALQIEEAERSKRETEKAGHSKRAKKNRERHERRQSEERRTTKIRTFNESRAEAVTEGVGEKMDVDPPEARGYRQVLDGGTGFLKVGYAGQNFPEHQYPSIVGRPILRSEERDGDIVVKDIMCGDEAAAARSMLQITYPMENGIVKRWDDMQQLWDFTFFEKMRVDPTGRKILLTEPPMNPLKNREQMCQVMFERYNFGGV